MGSIELILAVFEGEARAGQALPGLKKLEHERGIRLLDGAVLAKDVQGKTRLEETRDLGSGRGSLFGALVGGLVGLLGGPAGALVGAAAGAVTGGFVAGLTDLGFSDDFLAELQQALKPGYSALLLLVDQPQADAYVGYVEQQGAQVLRHAVRQELAERLRNMP
jgi:uncharacterized membrane protein